MPRLAAGSVLAAIECGGNLPATSLPVVRVRELFPHDDLVGRLRGSQLLADEGPQLVAVDRFPATGTMTAAIRWPHSSSGTPDDGDVGHGRVLDQYLFDLGGGDVLTTADDRVVGSSLDEQIAVGVEIGTVAGGKPSLGIEGDWAERYSPDTCFASEPEVAGLADREH